MHRQYLAILFMVGASCGLGFTAKADTVIYQDSLTGTGSADGSTYQTVAGTQPAIDLPNATWNAQYYAAPNATPLGWNSYHGTYSNSFSAQLPLTLDGTGVYTFSVDVNYGTNVYQNLDFGFIPSGQSTSSNPDSSTSFALIEVQGGGPATAFYGNGTTATGSTSTSYTAGTPELFSISLDSSTGSLAYSLDGTVFASYANALTPTEMSQIADITLGGYYGPETAYYTNLSVTEVAAVPEPGTWALMLAGLALLAMRFRSTRRL
jgi:hypothetical protein